MFGKITIEYDGKSYTIDHTMRLIQAVRREAGNLNEVDLCIAFAAALNYAGADVDSSDVYEKFMLSTDDDFAKYIGQTVGKIINPFNEATDEVNAKQPAANKQKPRKQNKKKTQ